MRTLPCKDCLVFSQCKMRERERIRRFMEDGRWGRSVIDLAYREKCNLLLDYLSNSDQDQVNKVRELFGMDLYL